MKAWLESAQGAARSAKQKPVSRRTCVVRDSFESYARPRVIRGTRTKPLPLLPSGPGGVHSRPLHEARSLTTIHANTCWQTGLATSLPRSQSRNPAGHIGAEEFVFLAEARPHFRFLVRQHKQVRGQPHHCTVFQHPDVAE